MVDYCGYAIMTQPYSILPHVNQSIIFLPTIFNLQKYYHLVACICASATPQAKNVYTLEKTTVLLGGDLTARPGDPGIKYEKSS